MDVVAKCRFVSSYYKSSVELAAGRGQVDARSGALYILLKGC